MSKNWLLITGIAVLLVVAAIVVVSSGRKNQPAPEHSHEAASHPPSDAPAQPKTKPIPAYYAEAPSRASLAATLDPERFTGLTRDAYRAVRQIPQTIAQLPCYCHCDRGFGHKSLYSCFEDDHAAHCAVCVNEALLALKLEKEQKLTPAQIRERIVQQYAE